MTANDEAPPIQYLTIQVPLLALRIMTTVTDKTNIWSRRHDLEMRQWKKSYVAETKKASHAMSLESWSNYMHW